MKNNKKLVDVKNHNTTYVVLIVDESGSMQHLRSKVISVFNERLGLIKKESKDKGQQTFVGIVRFSNGVGFDGSSWLLNSEDFPALAYHQYNPCGGTALRDAVGTTVQRLSAHDNGQSSFLIMTLTDGAENSSVMYNVRKLSDLIKEKQATDRWTFTFEVPPGYKDNIVTYLGVPDGNVREWEGSEKGLYETQVCTQSAVSNYYNSRSLGLSSTNNFYVATDLSKVKHADLQRNLDDLADQFKILPVKTECQIRDFVEQHGILYKKGIAFYELTKPEVVQEYKEVLIMERGKNHIWGNEKARSIIGLPIGKVARVQPKNHANYRIWISSTSVNRKLVRGTNVLVKK